MTEKIRVLVVDDEPRITRMVGSKLRASGYEVITAGNGKDAVHLVETEKPDVMLLDILLPCMDGFEVLQKVRSFSDLPVIAFSGMSDNKGKAISLGANDFLSKPFNPEELVKRIRDILNHSKN